MQGLEQLCYLYGVGYEYTRYDGANQVFDSSVRLGALKACGIDIDDQELVERLNHELDIEPWFSLLPACSVVEQSDSCLRIRVRDDVCFQNAQLCIWHDGEKRFCDLALNTARVTGDYVYREQRYVELAAPIPCLEVGYYKAELTLGERRVQTELWVTPRLSHQVQQDKMLGLSLQLYSLRSRDGFGIGDFADLARLVVESAGLGVDYVLLNPLHLLFENEPERASPYSPNSRCLLNPLYISPVLCIDFVESEAADALMQDPQILARFATLNGADWLDYGEITSLKYQLFTLMFEQFETHGLEARKQAFSEFCIRRQSVLSEFDGPDSRFACYLQWLAHGQLADCQRAAVDAGMAVGLINDLAVGCSPDGKEFNSNRDLFAKNVSVGAPPDPWSAEGQDWGLPALEPRAIRKNHFAYFRDLLAENMREVGGLRIDHVMALRRLWWCLGEGESKQGVYVYYPFEHLLAALKIESRRWHCTLIGEDLGVVPAEVGKALADARIFSNILFYFEKDFHGDFLPLSDMTENALLMVANHDVPPFVGWWQGVDLSDKQAYGLWRDEAQYSDAREERLQERGRLVAWLHRHGRQDINAASNGQEVYHALVQVLASAPSRLFTLQLDDLDGQQHPVNIPGTDREYPNWRRRVSQDACDILQNNKNLFNELVQIRQGGEPK